MPLPNIKSLTVAYKYHTKMPIYVKAVPTFVQTIVEKYNTFKLKQNELHVSPFYTFKNEYFLQLSFDFDGPYAYTEAQSFCKMELVKEKLPTNDWFVEFSGVDQHIVNHTAYGPIFKSQIPMIRNHLRDKVGRHYSSLDISTSIRHLPIRRSLSLDSRGKRIVLPIRVTTFLTQTRASIEKEMTKYDLTEERFKDILINYVLPTHIKSLDDAPFGLFAAVHEKKKEKPEEVKPKGK